MDDSKIKHVHTYIVYRDKKYEIFPDGLGARIIASDDECYIDSCDEIVDKIRKQFNINMEGRDESECGYAVFDYFCKYHNTVMERELYDGSIKINEGYYLERRDIESGTVRFKIMMPDTKIFIRAKYEL
ncbi:hypothetical protein RLOatenuis_7320 [Rickettsiales bacterium]|nr:hypothetical protein RLOatenuis_7320 [Rickettsiales bacterium]